MSTTLEQALNLCEQRANKSRGPRLQIDWKAVVRLWFSGKNQHQIAACIGIRQGQVSRILRACGIHAGRGKRDPVHILPMEEVRRLYEEGQSTCGLGKRFGVDPEVIRKRMKKMGIPRRTERGARGEKNAQWKGGRQETMHYHRRQAYEVAAICLGQPLPKGWVIHHCDENPRNNNPENLLLFQSAGDHARFHQRLLAIQQTNPEVDTTLLALESGAQALPLPPNPIELPLDTDQPAPSKKQRKPMWAHRKIAQKQTASDLQPAPPQ